MDTWRKNNLVSVLHESAGILSNKNDLGKITSSFMIQLKKRSFFYDPPELYLHRKHAGWNLSYPMPFTVHNQIRQEVPSYQYFNNYVSNKYAIYIIRKVFCI